MFEYFSNSIFLPISKRPKVPIDRTTSPRASCDNAALGRQTDSIHVRLGVDLHRELKKTTSGEGISIQDFVLDAIQSKLHRKPSKPEIQRSESLTAIPTWLQGLSEIDLATLKATAEIIREQPPSAIYRVFLSTLYAATKEFTVSKLMGNPKPDTVPARPKRSRAK